MEGDYGSNQLPCYLCVFLALCSFQTIAKTVYRIIVVAAMSTTLMTLFLSDDIALLHVDVKIRGFNYTSILVIRFPQSSCTFNSDQRVPCFFHIMWRVASCSASWFWVDGTRRPFQNSLGCYKLLWIVICTCLFNLITFLLHRHMQTSVV